MWATRPLVANFVASIRLKRDAIHSISSHADPRRKLFSLLDPCLCANHMSILPKITAKGITTSMRRALPLLAILVFICAQPLKADTLRTFALQASDQYTNVSGLVVIDTTTGQALYGYADLTLVTQGDTSKHPPFPDPIVISGGGVLSNGGCLYDCMNHPDEHSFRFTASDSDGSFGLLMTTPHTLVDYMGGHLCFIQGACETDAYTYATYTVKYPSILVNGIQYPAGEYSDIANYFNATLTYVDQVTTPEPSSLILMGSGALGLLGALRRKVFCA